MATLDGDAKSPWYRQLYFWVIVAIVVGVLVGWLVPGVGRATEPIGTTFVAAMRMLIGPIVFLTIIGGIAGVADLRKVGLTGVKALVYSQAGTLLALATGLLAINLLPLGRGVHADASTIEVSDTVGGAEAGDVAQSLRGDANTPDRTADTTPHDVKVDHASATDAKDTSAKGTHRGTSTDAPVGDQGKVIDPVMNPEENPADPTRKDGDAGNRDHK